ncbi:MAG TPA: hypothetical protein VE733_00875 [Streptosporangiaceae bacterium]|jgi:hypothetical protein|nr:hypothetical protein [Streptosporangiaceae bacterium]
MISSSSGPVSYVTTQFLLEVERGRFASTDEGEQLKIVAAPRRRLEELVLAADDTMTGAHDPS